MFWGGVSDRDYRDYPAFLATHGPAPDVQVAVTSWDSSDVCWLIKKP